jgi:hypothetical protein
MKPISRCPWSAVTELDLDYLERRREHARDARGPPPETEASPDSMDLVKVILLGAPAVGKTSIIQVGYVPRALFLDKYSYVHIKHFICAVSYRKWRSYTSDKQSHNILWDFSSDSDVVNCRRTENFSTEKIFKSEICTSTKHERDSGVHIQ